MAAQGAVMVPVDPAPAPTPPEAGQETLAEELWASAVADYLAGKSEGRMGAGFDDFRASVEADARHAQRHYFVGCITSLFRRDREEAARSYERAIAADPLFAYAYQELCQLYEACGNHDAARAVARRAVEAGARWTDEWQHPPAWTPGLTARPWWGRESFPWAERLESAWTYIRDEALRARGGGGGGGTGMPGRWDAVGSGNAAQDADIIVPGGEWREFVLFGAAADRVEAATSCPATVQFLESLLPGAVAMANIGVGEIMFSALAPGTKLAPHCASTNVRLTCHLGLVCPEGAQIKVGPTWGGWEEGRCMFFDDSFTHEVVNDSDSVRIVLLIRFWHPELAQADWMPTLQKGVEEYEQLSLMRMMPPMNALAEVRLREAAPAHQREGAAATPAADPASLVSIEAAQMAVGAGEPGAAPPVNGP